MTNEQLATIIQGGNANELKPLLWEKVRPLLQVKARDGYSKYYTRCKQCGIELTDIYQECYGAFEEGLKAYKPESNLKFTSFLSYPLKNLFKRLLGYANQNETPLNTAISLETPLKCADDDLLLLLDTLQDEQATEFINRIESQNISEQVRTIIAELPDRPKRIIIAYYLEGMTLQAIAAELGISDSRVQQLKAQAMRTLRKSPQLKRIYTDFYQTRYHRHTYYQEWNPEKYYLKKYNKPPESYAREQEKQYKLYNKWKDEIIIEYYL